MCYFAAAEAGGRSLEAAAQVQAADLGLELKCSTDVWLVSVPWLMSCGTGWYHASRWHPRSDQSTVSKCFPTEDTTCPAQLLLQTAACPTCGPRCTARQRNFPSDLQHNYQPLSLLTPDSLYFAFFFICTRQICYERKKESGAPLLLLQMKCRVKRPCRVFDEFIKANIFSFFIILNNTAFNKLFLYLTSDCCDPVWYIFCFSVTPVEELKGLIDKQRREVLL